MSTRSGWSSLLALGVAVQALAAGAAPAPTPPPIPDAAAATAGAPAAAGLSAFIDPVTGALRGATAADLAAAAAANPIPVRDDAAITVTVHPDGMSSAVLDASFMSTAVARIGPDGRVITGCVTSRAEYDAFFAPATTPATPEVR